MIRLDVRDDEARGNDEAACLASPLVDSNPFLDEGEARGEEGDGSRKREEGGGREERQAADQAR